MKKIVSSLIIGLTIFSMSCSKNTDPIGPGGTDGGPIIKKEIPDALLNVGNILPKDEDNVVEYFGALVIEEGVASSEAAFNGGAGDNRLPLVFVIDGAGARASRVNVSLQSIVKGIEDRLKERLEDFAGINAAASKVSLESQIDIPVGSKATARIMIEISSKGNAVFEDGSTTKKIPAYISVQKGSQSQAPKEVYLPARTILSLSAPFAGSITADDGLNNASMKKEYERGTAEIPEEDKVYIDLMASMNETIQSAGYTFTDVEIEKTSQGRKITRSSDTIDNITSYTYTLKGIKSTIEGVNVRDVTLTVNISQLKYKTIKDTDIDLRITTPDLEDVAFDGLDIVNSYVPSLKASVYGDNVTYKDVVDKVVAAYNAAQASIDNGTIPGIITIEAANKNPDDNDTITTTEKNIRIDVVLSVNDTDEPDYLFFSYDNEGNVKRNTSKTVVVNINIKKGDPTVIEIPNADLDITIKPNRNSVLEFDGNRGFEIVDGAYEVVTASVPATLTVPSNKNFTYRAVSYQLISAIEAVTTAGGADINDLTISARVEYPNTVNPDVNISPIGAIQITVITTLTANPGYEFENGTTQKVIRINVDVKKNTDVISNNDINADITGAVNTTDVTYGNLIVAAGVGLPGTAVVAAANTTVTYAKIANDIVTVINSTGTTPGGNPINDVGLSAEIRSEAPNVVVTEPRNIAIDLTLTAKSGNVFENGSTQKVIRLDVRITKL